MFAAGLQKGDRIMSVDGMYSSSHSRLMSTSMEVGLKTSFVFAGSKLFTVVHHVNKSLHYIKCFLMVFGCF